MLRMKSQLDEVQGTAFKRKRPHKQSEGVARTGQAWSVVCGGDGEAGNTGRSRIMQGLTGYFQGLDPSGGHTPSTHKGLSPREECRGMPAKSHFTSSVLASIFLWVRASRRTDG